VFEEFTRFGEGFALEFECGLVFFEGAVDGGWADRQELFPNGRGNTESRPLSDEGYLLADEGG
jgi:hypothetical protein